jgi:hypothetical protein
VYLLPRDISEKLAGKTDTDFDYKGFDRFMRSSSVVSSPGTTFQNSWDKSAKRTAKNGELTDVDINGILCKQSVLKSPDKGNVLSAIFLTYCKFNPTKVKVGEKLTERGVNFYAVEGNGIKGWYSEKTGKLRFLTEKRDGYTKRNYV